MSALNNPNNFAGRVNYAAAVIARNGRVTGAFEGCFLCHDADAVAAALIRRARRNPRIDANLDRYIGRAGAEKAAKALKGRKLAEAARDLRAANLEWWAAKQREWSTGQQAEG